ncbi:MAG: AAA family ATPase [Patescibacteria group bacterium]
MNFLKRLELTGFKSFAQKAVFEFPAGITAIVGPNGSGKSNVVDAIRWLLGEREARNLRGAKVEDLIFAGTPQRPRLGMAQAALHFENKNNFFPVEFAEVSIMRQVSRDGASRYFLNKSEVLLRDLIDFLAKARLGSKGMTVVTQGNSDIFIRATPKERREMIEEVLGLREYQLKKLDSERRLKNSRINLDKALALVEEILPHLRSLKRQTARWEKRGELEDELRELEQGFFGSQLHEIRSGMAETEKKIGAGKAEFSILERERKIAEEKQRKVEESQPEEREMLKKIKAETQDLLEKRRQLEKDLGRLEAQIELSVKSGTTGPPTGEALSLLKSVREELKAGLGGDFVELRSAVESALERIEEWIAGGNKAVVKQVAPELESQLKKVNQELAGLEATMRDLKAQEGQLEKGQEEFYKSFKAAVREVEVAKDKIEKWQLKNREVLFEKERLDLRREELLRQIGQAGREARDFEHWKPSGDMPELREAERRIFKLRGDLASIGDIDEALMKEARETETRYEFLKKESEDLEKAVADLGQLISGLNEKLHTEFDKALVKINDEFEKFFGLMFGGGQARLRVEKKEERIEKRVDEELESAAEEFEDEEEEAEEAVGGVLINLKLPRKKISSLEVLSGGERSLVGIAAIFAMISVSPPPFLVLDEIDAPLDDRNARRFAEMLKEFSKKTQFVIVTHNRATMEAADVLYGVTLNEDGTSKLVSLKL